MEPTTQSFPHRLRFGSFEIDLQTRELRKNGLRVKLSPQAFCTLECLLEHPGEVVTREDLFRRIWPGDVHVQFEANLNAIIRVLREVLGDSARNPRFIATEPKLGYRFLASVSIVGTPPVSPAFVATAHGALRSPWRIFNLLTIPALLAVGSAATWRFLHSPASSVSATVPHQAFAQITHLLGKPGHPSFSPDGSMLAFHWNGEERGGYDIYVKRLGSADVRRLTTSPTDDVDPVWSPDGRYLAFLRKIPGFQTSVVLVPAMGDDEREVARLPRVKSMSWSRDGKWIVYSLAAPDNELNPAPGGGLRAISPTTGRTISITSPAPDTGDFDPAFSWDGHQLAFIRRSDVYVIDIDENLVARSQPHKVTFDAEEARSPVWTPDGASIVYTAGQGSHRKLWRLPYRDGRGSPVQIGENALEPTIAASGRYLAYSRSTLVDSLSLVSLCRPDCSPEPPKRLFSSAKIARNASYSPDGRRIAFESTLSGHAEIWVCDLDRCNPKQVTNFGGSPAGTPNWSPDGKHLVFDVRLETGSTVFVIPADGGTPLQLTDGYTEDLVPSWSHDGEWIYFSSKRTGALEVWRMPTTGGSAVRITKHGGFRALESYDGKCLYYSKGASDSSIWKVSVDGADEEQVIDSVSIWQNFSVTPRGIYFVPTSPSGKIPIQFYDFARRTTRQVLTADGLVSLGVAASPDDRGLVISRRESDSRDLILIELL